MEIETLDQVTKAHLQKALELCQWNKSKVAEVLDLDRRTVYRMIERYGLAPPAAAPPPAVSAAAPICTRCQERIRARGVDSEWDPYGCCCPVKEA